MGCCGGGFRSGGASNPWRFVGNVDYVFFSGDYLSTDRVLVTLPPRTVLEAARIVTRAAFVRPGATYYNITLGVLGALDRYIDAYNAIAIDTRKIAWVFDEEDTVGWDVRIGAASDLGLDGFTAGSLDIWLKYWVLPAGS